MRRLALLAALLLALPLAARAEWEGWTVKGWVGISSLDFYNQRDLGLVNDGAFVETEVDIGYDFTDWLRLRVRPFIALDLLESSRNRYLALDGYIEYHTPRWSLLAGQLVESWAVTDYFSPMDVLNRWDIGFDTYRPPKLGELVLGRVGLFPPDFWRIEQPSVSLYFVPVFQSVPLPANDDRFAFQLTQDGRGDLSDTDVVPSSPLAYGARVQASLGGADISLVYFGGPGRIPSFANISPDGIAIPTYYRVDVFGGGLRWALGHWLLKMETVYTWTSGRGLPRQLESVVPPGYFQFVVGVERTFTDLLGKTELAVTVEYSGENKTGPTTLAALRPLRSDFLIGARWHLNDHRRTAIDALVYVDVVANEQLWQVDFETQAIGPLRFLLGGQFVNRAPRSSGLTVYNLFPNNSNIRAELRYEF